MIEISRLTKWYNTEHGKKFVLRDVSATIPSRCNVGIFGLNGSGKSTLLRLIGGTDQPDRGAIRCTGSVSWPLGLAGGTQGSMSGRDNTRFVCRIYGVDFRRTSLVCDFVREFAELGRDYELPVKTYSSGMRARLTFAISIAFDFDWYLIDEITSVGDEVFRRKSQAALEAKRGRCNWIKVSHDVVDLVKEADVGMLVHRGRVEVFRDAHAALRAYQVVVQAVQTSG